MKQITSIVLVALFAGISLAAVKTQLAQINAKNLAQA
jgi:hypothetical protein